MARATKGKHVATRRGSGRADACAHTRSLPKKGNSEPLEESGVEDYLLLGETPRRNYEAIIRVNAEGRSVVRVTSRDAICNQLPTTSLRGASRDGVF